MANEAQHYEHGRGRNTMSTDEVEKRRDTEDDSTDEDLFARSTETERHASETSDLGTAGRPTRPSVQESCADRTHGRVVGEIRSTFPSARFRAATDLGPALQSAEARVKRMCQRLLTKEILLCFRENPNFIGKY